MIEVVESAIPEVLTEAGIVTIVESVAETFVVETTSSGPDILLESFLTDVVLDTQVQEVVATEIDTQVVESSSQGPAGPAGPVSIQASYLGRTLVYTLDALTEVRLYVDAAKTQLAERKVMAYSLGKLATIQFFDGAGALSKTRTLGYSAGVLTSVVDT